MSVALEARDLTVSFGRSQVVCGLSTLVRRGEWVALIGPNGAGKTTTLRALAGLVSFGGEVLVDGRRLEGAGRREIARQIAIVPQHPQTPPELTVAEYVLLGRTPHIGYLASETHADRVAAERAIERLALRPFAQRALGSLSGGELQRAVLARALAQEARILLLDEPTSSLDLGRQQQALELVDSLRRDEELTVVAAMHDLSLAGQYADRLLMLDQGRIVAEEAPPRCSTRRDRLLLRCRGPRHHRQRQRLRPAPACAGAIERRADGARRAGRAAGSTARRTGLVGLVLLLGGARSGKSQFALRLAASRPACVFIATGEPGDDEMGERIARHRAERPEAWQTIEEPLRIREAILSAERAACVVLDCLTLWTANALAEHGSEETQAQALAAAQAASSRPGLTIVVSNEVGLGIVPANALARSYRDLLGSVNAIWARAAEHVLFFSAGKAARLTDPDVLLEELS